MRAYGIDDSRSTQMVEYNDQNGNSLCHICEVQASGGCHKIHPLIIYEIHTLLRVRIYVSVMFFLSEMIR